MFWARCGKCEPILINVCEIINVYVYIQDNLLVCMGAIYDTEQEKHILAEKYEMKN